MTRILRRATRALAALLVAAFLSGCYTAAPAPQASRAETPFYGYTSFESPSGSIAVGVFTSAPQIHGRDGSIWYYGNHPHPVNHALGSFCELQGSHRHEYAPYRSHRYAFHDGHYFWIGDAQPYAARNAFYAYQDHHPHPHYFGGTCRIHGLHQHVYAPTSADYYRLKSGAYFFTGVYHSDYYAERGRYDARGWKLDHQARGYYEHERAWQEEQALYATGENRPSHTPTGSQLSREGSVETAARLDTHQVTPHELLERMRARARGASGSVPANAAD